jgi:hypothetical protein
MRTEGVAKFDSGTGNIATPSPVAVTQRVSVVSRYGEHRDCTDWKVVIVA